MCDSNSYLCNKSWVDKRTEISRYVLGVLAKSQGAKSASWERELVCDAAVPWQRKECSQTLLSSILGEIRSFFNAEYAMPLLDIMKKSLSPVLNLATEDCHPRLIYGDTLAPSSCWCVFGLSHLWRFGKVWTVVVLKNSQVTQRFFKLG